GPLELLLALPDAGGQIDPDHFIAAPGAGAQVHQGAHVPRDIPGLLGELTGGRDVRGLAAQVEQAGRDLPQAVADGVPVLADQQHPVGVVDGEHRHGARVPDVLAVEAHAVGEVDGVAHQV